MSSQNAPQHVWCFSHGAQHTFYREEGTYCNAVWVILDGASEQEALVDKQRRFGSAIFLRDLPEVIAKALLMESIEVPPYPTTDEEFAALPVLDLNKFAASLEDDQMIQIDPLKLNSATKYPSIDTYHRMGDKGVLMDERLATFSDGAYLTEKVDGTNGRIVFMPDGEDYYIGSREHLLYAKGDRVINPALGVVEALKPIADRLTSELSSIGYPHFTTNHTATVLYAEIFGHQIGAAAKEYTKAGQVGVRMFDMCSVDLTELAKLETLEQVSFWREKGHAQEWYDESSLLSLADELKVPLVPRLSFEREIPETIEETLEWLRKMLPATRVGLDAHGRAEGIVLRNEDRSAIVKARFQDYERTLRIHNGAKR